MIYSGSVIQVKENCMNEVKAILEKYPQVEVYTQSEDLGRIIITIEERNNRCFEKLCSSLKDTEEIIDISHTHFYFGEEVEEMLNNTETEPTFIN